MACDCTGGRDRGEMVYRRWTPGSAGMAMPGVPLDQSFKGITCFGHALHVNGVSAALTEKGFWVWLAFWSMLAFQVIR